MCLRDVTADIALAVAPNVTPDVSQDVAPMDRGRDGALVCAAPASEPDWRISRTRLSSRQFYLTRIKISMTGTQKAPMQICLKGLCPWSTDVLGQSVPRPLSLVMDELPTARNRRGKGTENSSPRLSPYGQSRGLKPHPHTNTASPFLHPLAPRALPSFLANTPGSRKPLADLVLSPVSRSGLHLERAGSS